MKARNGTSCQTWRMPARTLANTLPLRSAAWKSPRIRTSISETSDTTKLAASIAEVPVTVSGAQLQQIAYAAAKGAEEGSAAGAKAAISGLSFVVTAA